MAKRQAPPHDLNDWLKSKAIPRLLFLEMLAAKGVQIRPVTLRFIIGWRRYPGREVYEAMHALTGLPYESFYGQPLRESIVEQAA